MFADADTFMSNLKREPTIMFPEYIYIKFLK